jgi:hypothetical protein
MMTVIIVASVVSANAQARYTNLPEATKFIDETFIQFYAGEVGLLPKARALMELDYRVEIDNLDGSPRFKGTYAGEIPLYRFGSNSDIFGKTIVSSFPWFYCLPNDSLEVGYTLGLSPLSVLVRNDYLKAVVASFFNYKLGDPFSSIQVLPFYYTTFDTDSFALSSLMNITRIMPFSALDSSVRAALKIGSDLSVGVNNVFTINSTRLADLGQTFYSPRFSVNLIRRNGNYVLAEAGVMALSDLWPVASVRASWELSKSLKIKPRIEYSREVQEFGLSIGWKHYTTMLEAALTVLTHLPNFFLVQMLHLDGWFGDEHRAQSDSDNMTELDIAASLKITETRKDFDIFLKWLL